jgi:hypothetical protein
MSLSALCFQPARRASCCDRNYPSFVRVLECRKIQAICNEKLTPFAMQGPAMAREKPPAQEQWVSMEKQCEEQWTTMKNTMGVATSGCNTGSRQCGCARRCHRRDRL